MRSLRITASLILAALLLSACNIIIGEPRPNFDDALDAFATGNANDPAATGTIGPNSSVDYRVDLTGVSGYDLFYIELDADLELQVYRSNATIFASSSSADGFVSGFGGLSARGVAPQAIGVNRACGGSCVIARPSTADHVYARVINHSGLSRPFTLYAFGSDYGDTNERFNDDPSTSPLLSSSDSGAIETLGDVDYYETTLDGTVRFTTVNNALGIVAYVSATGDTLQNGDVYQAVPGDIVRVSAPGGSRAGAPAVSGYTLAYVP